MTAPDVRVIAGTGAEARRSGAAGRGVDVATLITRLEGVLASVDLDCGCRDKLQGALARFSALEQRRSLRRGLHDARDQRDRIAAILGFLAELDQIAETEPDRSVFEEIALLFEEIAASATAGAAAIRELRARTPDDGG
ncbi:hypothetical protein QNA08_08160 [Chelatococcus sp. SYSU_G07232]|uniref:HPt domain-containing protein n=1 Tax=Chelatococcus albus TaxID=3047466 RepID=A0ABT7AFQ6_9HYPH|nr:hypothetical protein [Chelatococcus sp. SYSU_G07232]MDJ1158205.1 hypothetical protein [Chelatococcus sp. SYSU_G07232]